MAKLHIEYRCSICEVAYPTEAEAVACERQPADPLFASVGDIVFCRAGFGWFDGDPRWVENLAQIGGDGTPDGWKRAVTKNALRHGNCFSPCCTYRFYYVVTKIDTDPRDGHRCRYHLRTGAMVEGYGNGWTYNENHIAPQYVVLQPAVIVELGKAFLGREAEHLL